MNADHSPTIRGELYPEIEPYRSGTLRLDGVHEMYFEECGNPRGQPVVFLHGGPGAGSAPAHRRVFDPAPSPTLGFYQRGAGRSRPPGGLCEKTKPPPAPHPAKVRAPL